MKSVQLDSLAKLEAVKMSDRSRGSLLQFMAATLNEADPELIMELHEVSEVVAAGAKLQVHE